jgi:FG-GAP-like repeat
MNRCQAFSSVLAFLLTTCSSAAPPGASSVTLAPAAGSPLTMEAYAMAVADVNGDRHLDLIVTAQHLQIFLGDGSGRFRTVPDFDLDLKGYFTELVVADVNADGKLDVITAQHDQYSVWVFLGDGKGKFTPAPASPFWPRRGDHPHSHGLLVCDVNKDNKLDIITANNADGDIAVMLGDGRGGFSSAAKCVFPSGPSPYPLAAADVNEDGSLDILVPNSKPDLGTMTVMLGNGKGEFAASPSSPIKVPAPARDVYYVSAADINRDGHIDVLLDGNHDDCASILFGDGHGNFKPAPQSPLHMGNRGWNVAFVDFDHDGTLDLISVNEKDIRIHWGDGHGWFKPNPLIIPSGGKGCWKLAVGDLNEDGFLDVITPNVESKDLTILLSNASSKKTSP